METEKKTTRLRWSLAAFFLLVAGLLFGFKNDIVRARYQSKRATFVNNRASAPTWNNQAKAFSDNAATASSVFAGATKVEPFRMVPWLGAPMEEGIGKVEQFPYSEQAPTQNSAFAQRLGKIVLDPNSYTFTHKACSFNPTVAFRVWKAKQSVTVLICFGCNQLVILEKQAPLDSIGGIKGHFKVSGEFDLFRPELLALAKEAFPNDQTIQALPTYNTGLMRL